MSYQTHGHQHSVEGGGPHSHGVISASMVDLPAMNYAASTEYLGDIEEYPLSSNSSKSQSVPKLTLLTISTDDKSECSCGETASFGGFQFHMCM